MEGKGLYLLCITQDYAQQLHKVYKAMLSELGISDSAHDETSYNVLLTQEWILVGISPRLFTLLPPFHSFYSTRQARVFPVRVGLSLISVL